MIITPENLTETSSDGIILPESGVSVFNPKKISPLDDPDVWLKEPMFAPPAEVNIIEAQRKIDNFWRDEMRENNSPMKLVWNGDVNFWFEFFMEWNGLGQPTAPPVKRPIIRYKVLRDKNKKIVRDVFPPRWLLLARIEPAQYYDNWKKDSYFFAPEINNYKQIRPDVPPKDFYMWYATIAEHNEYCCATAAKNSARCFGKYADPSHVLPQLADIKELTKNAKSRNPYAELDSDDLRYINNEVNAYDEEIAKLKIQSEIFTENPLALLGIQASLKADVNLKEARQIVTDYFDRQMDEASVLITNK